MIRHTTRMTHRQHTDQEIRRRRALLRRCDEAETAGRPQDWCRRSRYQLHLSLRDLHREVAGTPAAPPPPPPPDRRLP